MCRVFFIDLIKKAIKSTVTKKEQKKIDTQKKKHTDAKTATSKKTKLPEGGEWKTVRGSKVYIKNGKILAGAAGKLTEKNKDIRKKAGASVKKSDDFAKDIEFISAKPFEKMSAPMLKRDSSGAPIKENVTDDDGNIIYDIYTGQPKKRYVVEQKDNATEDELIRDHQGLIISEVVNPFAERMNLSYTQRNWYNEDGQPTDLYGDLVQTANIGFLQGLREHAYKQAQGLEVSTTPLTQALTRSHQVVKRAASNIFGDIKIPRSIKKPLAILQQTKDTFIKKEGRKPTYKELDKMLKSNPVFAELTMLSLPGYDQETDKFVGGKKKEMSTVDKIKVIETIQSRQNVVSLDANKTNQTDRGNKETDVKSTLADPNATTEEKIIAQDTAIERDANIKSAVGKILNTVLTSDEADIIKIRFMLGEKNNSTGMRSLEEVAEKLSISIPLAKKRSATAMKKLQSLPEKRLKQLRGLYMAKSLLKALFIQDVITAGLTLEDMRSRVVKTVHTDDLQKSYSDLETTQFFGNVISTDTGHRVTVVELSFPFNAEEIGFEKSIGVSIQNEHDSISKYFSTRPKLSADMSAKQSSQNSKNTNPTWSEALQLGNKQSFWITWNGNKILIGGDYQPLVDMRIKENRDRFGITDSFVSSYEGEEDYGKKQYAQELAKKRRKWYDTDNRVGTYVQEWRNKYKKTNDFGNKKEIFKKHPEGIFLSENIETGKRVVYKVEAVEGRTGKLTTKITEAFDPDADERINIGDYNAVYKYLYGEGTSNANEKLFKDGNIAGKHSIDVLEEDAFSRLKIRTTFGAQERMVHTSFNDVTPETMKILGEDGKVLEVPYVGSKIYECDLGDGRIAKFEVSPDGTFRDSVMQQLINPAFPINDANDLYTALKQGINKETWVTIGSSSIAGLHHHVKIKYDGQGAPIVVGGAFEGFRFQDANDMIEQEDKNKSLFKNGRPVRPGYRKTVEKEIPFEIGNDVMIRNPEDRRKWVKATIVDIHKGQVRISIDSETYRIKLNEEMIAKGKVFPNGTYETLVDRSEMRPAKERFNIATEAPIVDVHKDQLRISIPQSMIQTYKKDYDLTVSEDGTVDINGEQFLQIRDKIGSFSLTGKGRDFLNTLYKQQASIGKPDLEMLIAEYDPSSVSGYRDDTFVKKSGFYNTGIEGMHHLIKRQKAIVGHGMGTGKTMIGVATALKVRDMAIKSGKKPGKTLVISPAGIQDVWSQEINTNTTVGATMVGSQTGSFGSGDVKSDQITGDQFLQDAKTSENHFYIMSYEKFMQNAEKVNQLLKSKDIENIIIDEAHAFKNPEGNRHKTLKTVASNAKNVWALTGTPMDNEVIDAYHITDAVTGGVHTLGASSDFKQNYMLKDGARYVGMKQEKLPELGEKLTSFIHFRSGYVDDIKSTKGTNNARVVFPKIEKGDIYRGEIFTNVDFDVEGGRKRPKPKNTMESNFYNAYGKMENKLLSVTQLEGLKLETEGFTSSKTKNYLPSVQQLQKYVNAPVSSDAFYDMEKDTSGKPTGSRNYPHTIVDGYKRYYKKNPDGTQSKELLPQIHQNNPKAQILKSSLLKFLNNHEAEMKRRNEHNKTAKPENILPIYPPKAVITSGYTTFGTDVVESVLRDIEKDKGLTYSSFTGLTQKTRDGDVRQFKNDPKNAFIVLSDAGKEGLNLGHAQKLIHYDQDFNPNKMAQKTARILRSNSWQFAQKDGRPNEVSIESISMPGTIEDALFRAQDRKIRSSSLVEQKARDAEGGVDGAKTTDAFAGAQKKWVSKKKKVKKSMVLYVLGRGK